MPSMDDRYVHPRVSELWSPAWTYAAWLEIETTTLRAQIGEGIVPDTDETTGLLARMQHLSFQDTHIPEIRRIEEKTKHDVVAFLIWLRGEVGQDSSGRWIHFGLTSSDVVDTAQGMRFRAMHRIVLAALGSLISETTRLIDDRTPVIGRTHGQVAEPMEMRARAWGWLGMLQTGVAELSRRTSHMGVCKLSGPVGTFAHNPLPIEVSVADQLNLRPVGNGATQIASRAALAVWATAANLTVQACAKIAHDIRLMTLLDEVKVPMADGQVGSSSMAHKCNPIRAERIGGLARMASGYALMLSDLSTWLERDIAHSSVERVAVPDLWHITMFCLEETTAILRGFDVQPQVEMPGDAYVSWFTLRYIERGHDIEIARKLALEQATMHPLDPGYDQDMQRPASTAFMANYPEVH